MTTTTRRPVAADRALALKIEAHDLIAKLQARIVKVPCGDETTNWGHVGDLAEIVSLLKRANGIEEAE